MPDFYLEFCYDAIFRDFPLMRLKGWQYFLWDQDGIIPHLRAFEKRYDDVITIFNRRNFVQEFDNRFRNTELWHAP